ncbi:hypothetical protein [Microbispora catharanthi]|uniref:hypothetical protein n=1 Tax=Microbispora catharanthi TaxID=1712871 RepID=UPI00197BAC48|nr:hypothetical protein [Microbispora catharanthi]
MRRIVLLVLVTAACGAPTTTTTPPPGAGSTAAYAACMRRQGHPLPEPVDVNNVPADAQAAAAKCRPLLPGGEAERHARPPAEDMAKLRAFAQCMRAHQIQMTDPLPDGNMRMLGRMEHMNREQLNADPAYKAALAACRNRLPEEKEKKR